MRRNGFSSDEITAVRQVFRETLWKPCPRDEQLARLDEIGADFPAVAEIAEFIRGTKRSITPGAWRGRSAHAD